MTTFTFERAWTMGVNTELGAGAWLNAVLGDTSRYTIASNGPGGLTVTGTAASGLEGWRVELTPATSFTVTSGQYPVSGAVGTARLYDPSGALVSTATDFPPQAAEFKYVGSSIMLPIFGAEVTGSSGNDELAGYRYAANGLDGGDGSDRLIGGSSDDVIIGGLGNDTIDAAAGDDLIGAGAGADSINAGAGFDIVALTEAPDQFEVVWLNQTAGQGATRVDGAEIVIVGDGGSRVYGALTQDFVIGGAGRDEMDGDLGDDGLAGAAGDDILRGQGGDDVLDGGEGADLLDGGAGFDTADYSLAQGAVTLDLRLAGAQQTGYGLDTLVSVEGVYGSDAGDTITGDVQANTLEGAAGDDQLDGFDGDDNLVGGEGADRLFGSAGNDTITDELGANFLRGGTGNDFIQGGLEFDDAHGNEGNDTLHGGYGDDWVVGGKDQDSLYGDAGGDVVLGNLGEDTIEGGDGADVVRGGQGDDTVSGGLGNDWVSGDRGADTLSGGAGADVFHTFAEAGVDRVTDFSVTDGDRVYVLPGSTYAVSQVGGDVVIDVTGGAQMTLVGVTLTSLPSGWIFGA